MIKPQSKINVKNLFFIPALILIIGCAGSPKPMVNGNTLDQSLKEASEEIDRRFNAGTKIAILNFNSPSAQFSTYVIDELTANLVSSKHLTIIDRFEIALRRAELNFQMSGEVDDDSMQAIGHTLGAQSIVSGSVTGIGNEYRIVIRVLNVESGMVEVQYRTDIVNDTRVQVLLGTQGESMVSTQETTQIHKINAREKAVDVSNNRISGELILLGIGARYERMLSSNMSLGTNVYEGFGFSDNLYNFQYGIDVFFRFYPWGRTFFLGAAAGYYFQNSTHPGITMNDGVAVTPEIGWKVDAGNTGGFYLQPGIKLPITLGRTIWPIPLGGKYHYMVGVDAIKYLPLIYLGIGYAF